MFKTEIYRKAAYCKPGFLVPEIKIGLSGNKIGNYQTGNSKKYKQYAWAFLTVEEIPE